MNKENILKAARKNKEKGKEYENKEANRSSMLGMLAALFVWLVLFLTEYFVANSINMQMLAVGMTASGVQLLCEGVKLKKIYLILLGVIHITIAVFSIFIFMQRIVLV